MTAIDIKEKISAGIKAFTNDVLLENSTVLFSSLGFRSGKRITFSKDRLLKEFDRPEFRDTAKANALSDHWKEVVFVFQLTDDEIKFAGRNQGSLDFGDSKRVNDKLYESYFVFAIELVEESYTRTQLSQITRAVNRLFRMPTLILFKYGGVLTLSVINRRLHKRDETKDVLEKVTLIKDISIASPHRAHIEILFDLSLDELAKHHEIHNFETLHEAWEKTLDTKELNKRFYIEIANWYFWASSKVEFPDDIEKNKELRNATNLIRLITRIIFIWFIKEKGLVPEKLFQEEKLKKILKRFYADNGKATTYYTAILQNLFFGTLNQKMDQREFTKEGSHSERIKQYGVKNLFRYANLFAMGESEALAIFKDIPFLNGGLFDCLDKEDEEGKVKYVDGFSRKPSKQPTVPDFLFFCEEKNADLNNYYGTTSKQYKVRGLIDILNRYKFTVTENTPIEEEVALDPELLGRVFENLLASYNPETKTTARKQTGSFYTPREIVNYMVNESLIAYLENALLLQNDKLILKSAGDTPPKNLFGESQPTQATLVTARGETNEAERKEINDKLRQLLSYTEAPHQFTKQQCKLLIAAIDQCKIIDPACGSGAFPMGILHTVVHVLHKLDPKNEEWKERQIARVQNAILEAENIDDPSLREKLLADLEENKKSVDDAFYNNELDYGRKLYLIENCIYGVDIQPIAVQIAKLRFFISLVIDQHIQPQKENLGVRPLPNLETKFVAANTLIGLNLPKQLRIENENIRKLKEELKQVRHHYFNAKSRREKLSFQKEDKKLRRKIGGIILKEIEEYEEGLQKKIEVMKDNLKLALQSQKKIEEKHRKNQEKLKSEIKDLETGLRDQKSIDEVAQQISAWDPYDQYATSSWFDPEWMFGFNDGFNIVIGNPPYVDIKALPQNEVRVFTRIFETAQNRINLYAIFIEKGYKLLSHDGNLCYINPNSMLINESYRKLRKLILNDVSILIKLPDNVFENAIVETIILLVSRNNKNDNVSGKYFRNADTINFAKIEFDLFKKVDWATDEETRFSIFTELKIEELLRKIQSDTKPLKTYVDFSLGITPYDKYQGHSEKLIESRQFHSPKKLSNDYVPLISGKSIHRYVVTDEIDEYLKYGDWLGAPREKRFFTESKIIVRQIVSGSPRSIFAGYSEKNHFFTQIGFSIIKKKDNKEAHLKYVLSLLNSSLINFYHTYKFLDIEKKIFQKVLIANCKLFPIRIPESQAYFIALVDKIISAKNENAYANTSRWERQLDVMIYHLYQLTFEESKIIDKDLSEEEFEKYRIVNEK